MIADFVWLLAASLSFTVWLIYLGKGFYPPDPEGLRNQIVSRVVGTLGGLIAGWAFNASYGVPTPQPAIFLLTLAAVFIGATVAVDLYHLAFARKR